LCHKAGKIPINNIVTANSKLLNRIQLGSPETVEPPASAQFGIWHLALQEQEKNSYGSRRQFVD
jgi:hypothetical protein